VWTGNADHRKNEGEGEKERMREREKERERERGVKQEREALGRDSSLCLA
jgi:hypothetical protein